MSSFFKKTFICHPSSKKQDKELLYDDFGVWFFMMTLASKWLGFGDSFMKNVKDTQGARRDQREAGKVVFQNPMGRGMII